MRVAQAKRLKQLEGENARTGRAVADLTVANQASAGSGRGKLLGSTRRRRAVTQAQRALAVSERRACQVLGQRGAGG